MTNENRSTALDALPSRPQCLSAGDVWCVPARVIMLRRTLYFLLVSLTTLFLSATYARIIGGTDSSLLDFVQVALFAILCLWSSMSFWTYTLGFSALLRGPDEHSIENSYRPERNSSGDARSLTALIMPVCDEDPERVFAALQAIDASLAVTGRSAAFEFFVLSDSTNPLVQNQEDELWRRWTAEAGRRGKLYLRRRSDRAGRKCGNVAEFCRRWGSRYDYMVVLDADSLMAGETLTQLVDLMDVNSCTALIQAPTLILGAQSLFARALQFSQHITSDIFIAGAAYWELSSGFYLGHNAIIRLRAFTELCGLPQLPGREPLGGEILSHDFVEAALLREAGWEVWLAAELRGSYEDMPSNLIDYAKRDRRWCQGNLQHLQLLRCGRFGLLSKVYFVMGVMTFAAALLWLCLLVVSGANADPSATSAADPIPSSILPLSTLLLPLLVVPKLYSLLLLLRSPQRRLQFGGVHKVLLSIAAEMLMSVLLAPIFMIYYSSFIIATLCRLRVGWPTQRRGGQSISIRAAVAAHWIQTALGLAVLALSYFLLPHLFFVALPITVPLILAIPISVVTSSARSGVLTRRCGLFLVPEETFPAPLVVDYHRRHQQLQDEIAASDWRSSPRHGSSERATVGQTPPEAPALMRTVRLRLWPARPAVSWQKSTNS